MDEPVNGEPRPSSGGTRSRVGDFPVVKAGLVLVLFVVGVLLLLATIHPAGPAVVAAVSTSSTSTTTTATGASTTSTTRAVTGTGTKKGHGHTSTTTTTVPAVAPTGVPLLVANGSGVSGAAAAVSARLHAVGWTTLPPTNASTQVTSSHVYYAAGQQAAAVVAASQLHIPSSAVAPYSTSVPVSSVGTAQVIVVVGPDVASSGSTTATTAASSSSTTRATTG